MSVSLNQVLSLTIGADPELFVYNSKTQKYVSAHDLFPGSKYDPFMTAKGAVQVDGVAAEFNIAPADEVEKFIENIQHTTSLMKMMLKNKDLSLVAEPVAYFDQEYFDALPDDAKALGCTPDFNAWTEKVTPTPSTNEPFRTGSGHIHLGFTEDSVDPNEPSHFHDCCEIVKQLDAVLYIPSHAWDQDTKRRSLYGKMGAFRPKPYGCEYRVLSNRWVSDPDLMEWIFAATQESHYLLSENKRLYDAPLFKELISKPTIELKDVVQYSAFLTKYGLPELPVEYRVQ